MTKVIFNGRIPWDTDKDLRKAFDDLVGKTSSTKSKRKCGAAKEIATKLTSVSGYTDGD